MKNVSFFNGSEADTERKRRMAAALLEQSKPSPTEVIGGIAVPKSPLEGLAKALTAGVGGYYEGQANRDEQSRKDSARQTMADAMEAYNRSQAGGETALSNGEAIKWNQSPLDQSGSMYANILMGNEDTAPIGMQSMMGQMQSKQDMANKLESFKQMMPLELALARQKQAISGQMTDYQRAMINLKEKGGGTQTIVDPVTGQVTEVPVYDGSQQAQELGVPFKPVDVRGLDDLRSSMYIRKTREDAQKRLQDEDFTKAAAKARTNINEASRFEELMKDQNTGGLVNTPIIGGLMTTFDPQLREMKSIQDKLAPQQREPGSGSSSDTDVKMFQNALPGPDKPKETNTNLIKANKAREDDVLEYQSFLSDFLEANGHLNGADKYWKLYIDANPIFDPVNATPKNVVLNPNRQDYRTFFQGGQVSTPQDSGVVNWEDLP